jgi:hypothetical protein
MRRELQQLEQARIISIDSGSSYMKAFDGTARVRFMAIVAEATASASPGDLRTLGDRYVIGDAALGYFTHEPARINASNDYHGSPRQRIQICEALRRLKASGAHSMLTLSLPYDLALDSGLDERLRRDYRKFEWEADGKPQCVTFDSVKIAPQGLGALCMSSPDLDPNEPQRALIVDIGSYTTDVIAAQRIDGSWGYVGNLCASWHKHTIGKLFDAWGEEQNKSGERVPDYAWCYFDIMGRAEQGYFHVPYRGQKIPIKESFDIVAGRFRRALMADLAEHCGPRLWDGLTRIVITGGGAQIMNAEPWGDPRVAVLGAWANVEGQQRWAQEAAQSAPAE